MTGQTYVVPLVDWTSSANRVAFFLFGLNQIDGRSGGDVVSPHR
jgi:hypothetical protein